jgi:hypothetical protein
MSISSIVNYLTQVKLQQVNKVLFPKQDKNLFSFYLPYSQSEAINFLLTKPFEYLSTVLIKNTYFWEFVNSFNVSEFIDLEFLYIPVTTSLLNSLKAKLPNYSIWNESKNTKIIYPLISYLLENNSNDFVSFYTIDVSSGFTHPFLPTFEFTGRVCLLNQTLLYEYKDSKGYYSVKDFYYLSPLRPIDLNYPLGIPSESQLTTDECQLKDFYPTSGDSYFVGEYQYQYTNSSYNPHIKFYLYANPTSQFLLQQPPKLDYKGAALSALSLVSIELTLILPTTPIDQSFTITQNSTNTLTIS